MAIEQHDLRVVAGCIEALFHTRRPDVLEVGQREELVALEIRFVRRAAKYSDRFLRLVVQGIQAEPRIVHALHSSGGEWEGVPQRVLH